jgi:hypothetical protein
MDNWDAPSGIRLTGKYGQMIQVFILAFIYVLPQRAQWPPLPLSLGTHFQAMQPTPSAGTPCAMSNTWELTLLLGMLLLLLVMDDCCCSSSTLPLDDPSIITVLSMEKLGENLMEEKQQLKVEENQLNKAQGPRIIW